MSKTKQNEDQDGKENFLGQEITRKCGIQLWIRNGYYSWKNNFEMTKEEKWHWQKDKNLLGMKLFVSCKKNWKGKETLTLFANQYVV